MIPSNWHIIDDDAIMAMMTDALRDKTQTAAKPEEIPEMTSALVPVEPAIQTPDTSFSNRLPVRGGLMLLYAILFIGSGSIPLLCYVFDEIAWGIFAQACNLLFDNGVGHIWAIQWIGWSLRYPMGLMGVCLVWVVIYGVIAFATMRVNPLDIMRFVWKNILKSLHDMRLLWTRGVSKTSQPGER